MEFRDDHYMTNSELVKAQSLVHQTSNFSRLWREKIKLSNRINKRKCSNWDTLKSQISNLKYKILSFLVKEQHLDGDRNHENGKYFSHCFLWEAECEFASKITACYKTNSE